MKNILPLAVLLLFAACGTESSKQPLSTQEALVGSWKNVSIEVLINHLDTSENQEVYRVDSLNWEKELGIKPILTVFSKDSTYISYYRNPQDSLVLELNGRWGVASDTLFMLPKESTSPSYYDMEIIGKLAHFKSHLDWDGDGKADDYYYGIQVKLD